MPRLVAGAAGGRTLRVPPGRAVRPTAERVREALFSSLGAGPDGLAGLRVLDLYAGSGALGLEALSRGAAEAVLVEAEPRVLAVLRANVAAVGLPGARVAASTVERWLASAAGETFDVVLADPPYALGDERLAAVLAAVVPLLGPGGRVVVERATRDGFPGWPEGLAADRTRRYGDTTLWYGLRS